jgi:DEAD/DEAH box helicase domain-containing protein
MAIMKEFSVENSFLHGNAIGQLITWLGLGKEAMETLLRRHAAALTATFAHIGQPSLDSEIKDWWTQLPDWMRDPDRLSEPGTWASSRESVEPRMRLRWPATLRKPADATHWAPGVVALDPSRIGDEKQLHLAWRHWLRLYNLMQILPVPLMATQNSLATHAMDVLEPAANRSTAGASSPASAWASCFGKAMSVLDAGMQYLADAALPPPDEIGYEWYGEARTVSAEAELCWLGLRIVVLMEHQYDYEAVWLTGGWKVVRAEGNWWERLSEMLKHAE